MIELNIVTGVAGAGKSSTLYYFEEAGYYVTDNVPFDAVPSLFNAYKKHPKKYAKVALAVSLDIALKVYQLAKNYSDFNVKFIGLDCSKQELLSRFRLSRKVHPNQGNGLSLEKAIDLDNEMIAKIRIHFTIYFDTTKLTKNEFRRRLISTAMSGHGNKFLVTFVSFGYKKMVPQDIETVFDVRLLPNPYWEPKLRDLTGLDKEIQDYVLKSPVTKEFLSHVTSYLDYYLPELEKSEREHVVIGIACSGGQHRSVAVAEYLKKYYRKKFTTEVIHKDLPK